MEMNKAESQKINESIFLKGGQSQNLVEYDEKLGRMVFVKTFNRKDEYQSEKEAYENCVLQILQMNPNGPYLNLISKDDFSCKLIFPFVSEVLARNCLNKNGYTEQIAILHFTKVVKGVILIHDKGMTHNDIKMHNILIDPVSLKDLIIDFGFAQFINRNQKSIKPSGTKEVNPSKMNEEIDQLQKCKITEISEYCPYQLDLFQLGMLLLYMILPSTLDEKNKKMFDKPHLFKSFWVLISKQYKEKLKKIFDISMETQKLIWQLVTGQIEEARQIFDQDLYTLNNGYGKKILDYLNKQQQKEQNNPQTQVTSTQIKETPNQMEEEIPQPILHQLKKDSASRADGQSTFDKISKANKKLNELTESYCDDIYEYQQGFDNFLKKNPRQVVPEVLAGKSVITNLSKQDLTQIILTFMGQNNQQIFNSPDLFSNNSLTLNVEQNFKTQEYVYVGDENEDDDDDCEEQFKNITKNKKVKMSIEIVSLNQNGDQQHSLIFNRIEGDYFDFCNACKQLEDDILAF